VFAVAALPILYDDWRFCVFVLAFIAVCVALGIVRKLRDWRA
jgi:hypothetical protein